MDKNTLDTLAAWGDRSNRETAHLMDIVIAGTIDHMAGHGTARLLPARLEEIMDRIGPRTRDADGAWIVTLFPPGDDLAPVNPYDVLAYCREVTSGDHPDAPSLEDIGGLVLAAAEPGKTLRDMGMDGYASFVEWATERYVSAAVDNQLG